jgi:hypothetical protein
MSYVMKGMLPLLAGVAALSLPAWIAAAQSSGGNPAQGNPAQEGPAQDGVPWIAQNGPAPPLAVNPSDGSVVMRTSLGQWRDFNSQMLAKRIDDLKAAAPGPLTLPKPAVGIAPPVELWSSVELDGRMQQIDGTVRTSAGADYKLGRQAVAGVAVEHAEVRTATSIGSVPDDKVAAHLNFLATQDLSVEATTQWETQSAAAGSPKATRNSVTIAPRLGHQFSLDNGETLSPFVTLKKEMVVGGLDSNPAVGGAKASQSAGVGLTLAKPDTFSLSVTADREELDAKEPANLKSRLQLSVPLH